jgi:hypothetical protein
MILSFDLKTSLTVTLSQINDSNIKVWQQDNKLLIALIFKKI